jgi:hypothetical protein
MPEPIEAEFAQPPIFTSEQEKHLQHLPRGDLADDPDLHPSATTTAAPSVHDHTTGDIENAEKVTIVDFEPGAGENPKEWGKGKKW